jgi:hypothetical protein
MTKPKRQARSRLLSKMLAEVKAIYGPDYVVKIIKRRGRGRPKKLYVLRDEGLVLTLDWMMEAYKDKGLTEREARKHAFAEIKAAMETEDPDGHPLAEGKRRTIPAETIERYYRAGVKKLRESEMSLAEQIDRIAAKDGSEEALNYEAVLKYDPSDMGGVTWWRYRRGKRALSAARRKQEK